MLSINLLLEECTAQQSALCKEVLFTRTAVEQWQEGPQAAWCDPPPGPAWHTLLSRAHPSLQKPRVAVDLASVPPSVLHIVPKACLALPPDTAQGAAGSPSDFLC